MTNLKKNYDSLITIVVLCFLFNKVSSYKFNKSCDCGESYAALLSSRIVGGIEATAHEYPWAAAIYLNNEMHCGGALINDKYILTAGHCIRWSPISKMKVILGMHHRSPFDGQQVEIDDAILHKNFFSHPLYDENDIALIRLAEPVQFTDTIQPVCLPSRVSEFWISLPKYGIVVGWGKTSLNGKSSQILQKTTIQILSPSSCNETEMGKYQTETVLCGYEANTDACQGDSGGPLISTRSDGRAEHVGIVSWGIGCASPNIPGIYTNVKKYLGWIYSNTKDAIYCKN